MEYWQLFPVLLKAAARVVLSCTMTNAPTGQCRCHAAGGDNLARDMCCAVLLECEAEIRAPAASCSSCAPHPHPTPTAPTAPCLLSVPDSVSLMPPCSSVRRRRRRAGGAGVRRRPAGPACTAGTRMHLTGGKQHGPASSRCLAPAGGCPHHCRMHTCYFLHRSAQCPQGMAVAVQHRHVHRTVQHTPVTFVYGTHARLWMRTQSGFPCCAGMIQLRSAQLRGGVMSRKAGAGQQLSAASVITSAGVAACLSRSPTHRPQVGAVQDGQLLAVYCCHCSGCASPQLSCRGVAWWYSSQLLALVAYSS